MASNDLSCKDKVFLRDDDCCNGRQPVQDVRQSIPAYKVVTQLSVITPILIDYHSLKWYASTCGSPLCLEWQVLPEADARVQDSLQEALSCPVRDPVICLPLARLKPGIPCSESVKHFAHPRKQAEVNPLLWHQDL